MFKIHFSILLKKKQNKTYESVIGLGNSWIWLSLFTVTFLNFITGCVIHRQRDQSTAGLGCFCFLRRLMMENKTKSETRAELSAGGARRTIQGGRGGSPITVAFVCCENPR